MSRNIKISFLLLKLHKNLNFKKVYACYLWSVAKISWCVDVQVNDLGRARTEFHSTSRQDKAAHACLLKTHCAVEPFLCKCK